MKGAIEAYLAIQVWNPLRKPILWWVSWDQHLGGVLSEFLNELLDGAFFCRVRNMVLRSGLLFRLHVLLVIIIICFCNVLDVRGIRTSHGNGRFRFLRRQKVVGSLSLRSL